MPSPFERRRAALDSLEREPLDVLVVGGGITGTGIARDAALRGMRVALVERCDFASGTSSRSSRLVHGGLRYLEHGYFSLVFESSRERRLLLRLAPHLVRPLAFTWPVYRGARVPRWKLIAGLALYDVLALFRNVAAHRPLGSGGILAREPALRREGLAGGARYFDAATDDARLTLANALGAAAAGAVVLNHAALVALRWHDGSVAGGIVTDGLGGREAEVRARVVVNAAGPWSDAVQRLERPNASAALRGTKGAHIAVPRERVGNREALTLLSPTDGRVVFVIPAGAQAIIGTTDTETSATPDDVRAGDDDVAYLLAAANHFFPAARLERGDVISAWAGIRPLVASGFDGAPASASREHAIAWTPGGMLAVSGGKLTTYRAMAGEAVDAIAARLGVAAARSPTERLPLPGGNITSVDTEVAAALGHVGDAERARHLVHAHGSSWREVWMLAEADPSLAAPLAPGLPYVRAELVHAVRREMAYTLGDLLIRRTRIAFEMPDHGRSVAGDVSALVASELEWNEERRAAALLDYDREVDRIFRIESSELADAPA
ncbi:MAG TPA: glycerol-3-phosphate dehydrogenase/oxidase [Gemmatimonadaceae bacterium]|nr:glycerol-3-phosphate dehydrogenase/oxidase [Gemmatimonadaceae bacterium]